jgi:redox-sensitive bicupin YhaK (pirin superfamily)
MPAVSAENVLVLPRLSRPDPRSNIPRPVKRVVTAHEQKEGAGFTIWRPLPGEVSMAEADPFLLLDQLGPTSYGPSEAVGAPWHPHRGFETVSYVLDGEISHHDSNGGGGIIGDTQWMTAGDRRGRPAHAVQLWVNLPSSLKMTPPKYQPITGDSLRLISSDDGGALIRIIAGELGEFKGPGSTHTPITYLHATIAPGAQVTLPWSPDFSALRMCWWGRDTQARSNGRLEIISSSCSGEVIRSFCKPRPPRPETPKGSTYSCWADSRFANPWFRTDRSS